MGKLQNLAKFQIKKITGGKDPVRLVEDFISKRGFDPQKTLQETTPEAARWLVPIGDDDEIEILLEGINNHPQATIYVGLNLCVVPIRGSTEMLAAALELADGLIAIKLSLVGHFLVLSSTQPVQSLSTDDLDYIYELILAQNDWFRTKLAEELGWTALPRD